MKRRDAMARLDEAVERYARGWRSGTADGTWNAYRRALRALLRERADAAVSVGIVCPLCDPKGCVHGATMSEVRAAVLGRRN